jgi:hypothetical protein
MGKQLKGGDKITIPYFEPLGDFEEVTDEAAPPSTVEQLTTTEEIASVRHFRLEVDLTYAAQAFADVNSDPYKEAGRQMLTRAWLRMMDLVITASRTTTLSLDVSGVGTGFLTYDAIIKGQGLFADEEFDEMGASRIVAYGMHSNVLRQSRGIQDGFGRPLFIDSVSQNGTPTLLGNKIMTSDRYTVVAAKHETVLMQKGALALWYNQGKMNVQAWHDPRNDRDHTALHLYCAAHLYKRPRMRTKTGCATIETLAAA